MDNYSITSDYNKSLLTGHRLLTHVVPFLLVFFLATVCWSNISRKIIRILDETITPFHVMAEDVSSARAIFIGEIHNNAHHHKSQLDVIQVLHERGLSLSIGLEMFKKEDQEKIDQWVSGGMEEKDFIQIFHKNWGFEWEFYRDIFLYARDHKIAMIGLNVPHQITRKVGRNGFQSLTKEERTQLPPGVTCDVDRRYMDHLVKIFRLKGRTHRSFVNFCEAQVLWDQAMAYYLAQYLKTNPDKAVVVLTGSVHAWKYGIPRQLERFVSVKQKIILPDVPNNSRYITVEDADYLLVHG